MCQVLIIAELLCVLKNKANNVIKTNKTCNRGKDDCMLVEFGLCLTLVSSSNLYNKEHYFAVLPVKDKIIRSMTTMYMNNVFFLICRSLL